MFASALARPWAEIYRNPLNALVYLPLLPAFSKVGNIVSARKEMDDMVVDLLYVLMDFDLADLLGGIGTEVGLTNNSAHTLGMIKVMYPVEEYLSAFKLDFEGMQMTQESRKEKPANSLRYPKHHQNRQRCNTRTLQELPDKDRNIQRRTVR